MVGNPIHLGALTPVPVREIWAKEDRDFTPWLLDNAELLSGALGIDLELHQAEHPVGTFSLNLLGRAPGSEEVVIVENQLEESDHKHLGQLLTYAGGTDARTIVWIATNFREEHRSALDWLNENTGEGTRFFGVEISAVKIGDSVPAPLFNVVAKPNDWGKAVKANANTIGGSERNVAYSEFWTKFLVTVRQRHPEWTKAAGSYYQSWLSLPSGVSGISMSTTFNRRGLCSELVTYFENIEASHANYKALFGVKEDFEASYGGELEWDQKDDRKTCKISDYLEGADIFEYSKWDEYVDWLIDRQGRLREAFKLNRKVLP